MDRDGLEELFRENNRRFGLPDTAEEFFAMAKRKSSRRVPRLGDSGVGEPTSRTPYKKPVRKRRGKGGGK